MGSVVGVWRCFVGNGRTPIACSCALAPAQGAFPIGRLTVLYACAQAAGAHWRDGGLAGLCRRAVEEVRQGAAGSSNRGPIHKRSQPAERVRCTDQRRKCRSRRTVPPAGGYRGQPPTADHQRRAAPAHVRSCHRPLHIARLVEQPGPPDALGDGHGVRGAAVRRGQGRGTVGGARTPVPEVWSSVAAPEMWVDCGCLTVKCGRSTDGPSISRR